MVAFSRRGLQQVAAALVHQNLNLRRMGPRHLDAFLRDRVYHQAAQGFVSGAPAKTWAGFETHPSGCDHRGPVVNKASRATLAVLAKESAATKKRRKH